MPEPAKPPAATSATASADTGGHKPEAFAISPPIGPVPAIYVPQPSVPKRNPPGGTMPEIPAELRYSKDHLWARSGSDAGLVRVGVTSFAQQSLGDVVDVTLPEPGDTVTAGEACGDIESVKSLSDLIAPVTGTVCARNDDLAGAPELVNSDPYGQGWMFEVETDPATLGQQFTALMDADSYRALAGA
jgi:glycine cleavage system H protein